MSKFSKLKIKDSQMLSEVEMKNVIGGYGDLTACEGKWLGDSCSYYDKYSMDMRVSGKCLRRYKAPAGYDLVCSPAI